MDLRQDAASRVDGLIRRRLDRPYIRRGGRLVEAEWREALDLVAERLKAVPGERDRGDRRRSVRRRGDVRAEGAAGRARRRPASIAARTAPSSMPRCRAGYLFNTTIAGIEQADACLLIGTNPRWEAPLVNARLRKRYLQGGFKVAAIGPALDLTYPVEMLGDGGETLAALARGEHPWAETLRRRQGADADRRARARWRGPTARGCSARRARSPRACGMVRDGLERVQRAAPRRGAGRRARSRLRAGRRRRATSPASSPAAARARSRCSTCSAPTRLDLADTGSAFVIYQGHHGDRGAARADVVLPGAAYTEKDGTYVNTEGRVQLGRRAVFPPGEAREDWTILRALSGALGRPLPFDSLPELRRADARGASGLRARSTRSCRRPGAAFGEAGPIDAGAVRLSDRRFLPHRPDQPRQPDDGRVQRRCSRRPPRPAADRHAWLSFWHGYALADDHHRRRGARASSCRCCWRSPIYTYAERKVLAYSQLRKGPNVVGPFGLLQPIADGLKLLIKETIIPSGANRVVFIAAPMVTFTLALVAWAVIPFDAGVVDLQHQCRHPLSVRDQLAVGLRHHHGRLGVELALRLSRRAALGGADGLLRGLDRLCAGHRAALRRLAQPDRHRRWRSATSGSSIPLLPMFVIFFISGLAETNRAPFDLPEGESELVAGYFVEYSAMTLRACSSSANTAT